jgi:hypothetical protein
VVRKIPTLLNSKPFDHPMRQQLLQLGFLASVCLVYIPVDAVKGATP